MPPYREPKFADVSKMTLIEAIEKGAIPMKPIPPPNRIVREFPSLLSMVILTLGIGSLAIAIATLLIVAFL